MLHREPGALDVEALGNCSNRQFWITMSEQLPPSLMPMKPALSPRLLMPG